MNDPCVIDLSHHNPTPNWTTLKQNGVIGIIHKATEGTGFVDDQLFTRARAAMDAGLCWATYHFLRPGSMQQQMDHYLGTVNPVEGERVVLDHEDAGVSIADLEDAVEILLDDPRNLQVTIYSGHVIEEQLGSTQNMLLGSSTSLWTAEYTTKSIPTWPKATWPTWSLWQYSDKVTVPGIPAPIDGNRWNGDEASLRAWFGPAGTEIAPVPPEPTPEYETVDIAITTSDNVSVSLTVNGEAKGVWAT